MLTENLGFRHGALLFKRDRQINVHATGAPNESFR